MVTNNFVSAYKGALMRGTSNLDYVFSDIDNNQVRCNGDAAASFLKLGSKTELDWPSSEGCILAVGAGETAENVADYNLASIITSSSILNVVAQSSVIYSNSYNSSLGTVARTVQNIADDSLTIREIGLIARNPENQSVLLYREVLDTPVTLQPGKKYTFTIDLCVA